ncbi:transposase [Streptomyces sp. NPDC007856]|uniref:transposase n=1 Tax=Streptomyces sp. NPDC007856 TaxID=3364781 RepID=UPI0036BAC040
MKTGPPEQLVGVESKEHQEAPVPQSSVSMARQSNSPAPSCDCLAHVYGNAADRPERQRRYPSDMTDAEWVAIRPLLPVPGWMRGRGGRPEAYCQRTMLDAIRYLVDNGRTTASSGARCRPTSRRGTGSTHSSAGGATTP